MLTFLLWLSPFVVIGVVIWNFRRKVAAREAESEERFKAFLNDAVTGESAETVKPASTPPPPSVRQPGTAAIRPASTTLTDTASSKNAGVSSVQPAERAAVRERVLAPPQALLYYLLRSGLPDHEVLAQVAAGSLFDAGLRGSFESEARQKRLAGVVLDFVVCDKSFKAVAAVQCGARAAGEDAPLAYARGCCESAGLRWVELAPDALPRREGVRAAILGA